MFPLGYFPLGGFPIGYFPLSAGIPGGGGSGPLLFQGAGETGQYREDGNPINHETGRI